MKINQTFENILSYKHTLKILSIGFAFSLWFFVLSSRPVEEERKFVLKYILPSGKGISNLVANEIQVKLKGPRVYLGSREEEKNVIKIDLSSRKYKNKRKFTLPITQNILSIPFGVEVVDIVPRSIPIEIEKTIYKKVPIKPVFINSLSEEIRMVKFTLSPKELMIQGPRSVMKSIAFLETQAIDLSLISKSNEVIVPLSALDSRVKLKKDESQKAQFNNEIKFSPIIKPKKANHKVSGVPIRFLTSKRKFYTDVKKVSLEVLVSEEDNSKIKKSQFQVVADIPEGAKGPVRVELKANMPEGVHLLKIIPSSINVRIR